MCLSKFFGCCLSLLVIPYCFYERLCFHSHVTMEQPLEDIISSLIDEAAAQDYVLEVPRTIKTRILKKIQSCADHGRPAFSLCYSFACSLMMPSLLLCQLFLFRTHPGRFSDALSLHLPVLRESVHLLCALDGFLHWLSQSHFTVGAGAALLALASLYLRGCSFFEISESTEIAKRYALQASRAGYASAYLVLSSIHSSLNENTEAFACLKKVSFHSIAEGNVANFRYTQLKAYLPCVCACVSVPVCLVITFC